MSTDLLMLRRIVARVAIQGVRLYDGADGLAFDPPGVLDPTTVALLREHPDVALAAQDWLAVTYPTTGTDSCGGLLALAEKFTAFAKWLHSDRPADRELKARVIQGFTALAADGEVGPLLARAVLLDVLEQPTAHAPSAATPEPPLRTGLYL